MFVYCEGDLSSASELWDRFDVTESDVEEGLRSLKRALALADIASEAGVDWSQLRDLQAAGWPVEAQRELSDSGG